MEYERYNRANEPLRIIDAMVTQLQVMDQSPPQSEWVQKRLAEIDPDNLSEEALEKVKAEIFDTIDNLAQSLVAIFPTGDVVIGDSVYTLAVEEPRVEGSSEPYFSSLRHGSSLGMEELDEYRYITPPLSRGVYGIRNDVSELLDVQQTLGELLHKVTAPQG